MDTVLRKPDTNVSMDPRLRGDDEKVVRFG